MKNKLISRISIVVIVVAVFLFGWYLGAQKISGPDTVSKNEDSSNANADLNEGTISLMIDSGEGNINIAKNIPVVSGMNVFDFLFAIYGDQLAYKDYGGDLGVFIESINNVGGDGSDKWWQYWVNNDYSTVGVSGYKPKNGDVIMFKYTNQESEDMEFEFEPKKI